MSVQPCMFGCFLMSVFRTAWSHRGKRTTSSTKRSSPCRQHYRTLRQGSVSRRHPCAALRPWAPVPAPCAQGAERMGTPEDALTDAVVANFAHRHPGEVAQKTPHETRSDPVLNLDGSCTPSADHIQPTCKPLVRLVRRAGHWYATYRASVDEQ